MRTIRPLVLLATVAVALTSIGCAGPVVPITHVLPAAVPLPKDVVALTAGQCAVKAGPAGDFAADLKAALTERLARPQAMGSPSAGAGVRASVDGAAVIEVDDTAGQREIRQWDSGAGAHKPRQVPFLVRKVVARVSFAVKRPGGGEPVVTVEVKRSYNSLADPRIRGEAGLERPDDPKRVPAVDTVARELLTECADAFVEMVQPMIVTAEVQMRGTVRKDGAAGLKAAEAKDYAKALAHFQAAAAAAPNDVNLMFNRAVAAEAAGRLAEARQQYEAAVKASKGKDAAAVESAQRVRRVISHRKQRVK